MKTGGGVESPNPNQPSVAAVAALVDEVRAAAPSWQYVRQRVEGLITNLGGVHPFPVVRWVVLAVARGDYGRISSPRRILDVPPPGCDWWGDGYRAAGPPPPPAPPPRRQVIAECGRCDEWGWILAPGTRVAAEPPQRCDHTRHRPPVPAQPAGGL